MNRYPLWKNLLIVVVVVFGALVALPNVFGEDPAVQVSRDSGSAMEELEFNQVSLALDEAGISYNSVYADQGHALVRFDAVGEQLKASDLLRRELGKAYVVALTLAPRTPAWLRAVGLQPMSLGLDLRGGVHFLFEVDIEEAVQMRLKQYETDFDKLLRRERIKRRTRLVGDEVQITLGDSADADRAEELMRDVDQDVEILRRGTGDGIMFIVRMTPDQIKQRRDFAIQQNTITLRNRVNELGVAEPVVQRQGLDRIVVQLPGVQDPAQAERVLGATATLEFRLVCDEANPMEAQRKGRAPEFAGRKIFSKN
ncbi:MAG: protein translocase subunit SecD, partial [Gammaproteobacteria bacterium]